MCLLRLYPQRIKRRVHCHTYADYGLLLFNNPTGLWIIEWPFVKTNDQEEIDQGSGGTVPKQKTLLHYQPGKTCIVKLRPGCLSMAEKSGSPGHPAISSKQMQIVCGTNLIRTAFPPRMENGWQDCAAFTESDRSIQPEEMGHD